MYAVSACTIIIALTGAVPGESTGWGTGEVEFQAYVDTSEHQEIYPVCAGQARFADDPETADAGVANEPAYPKVVDIGAYEYIP